MNYLLNRPHWGKGISGIIESNSERIKVVYNNDTIPVGETVFRWGCISTVPGDPVIVNTASAIKTVFDKKSFRLKLSKLGLAPQSWGCIDDFGEQINPGYKLSPKLLVRKSPHFRSQDMTLCSNLLELATTCAQYQKKEEDYYISVFHDKHREFRVFVVSGRIVAMIEKHPANPESLSWGCVETGTFEYVAWTNWPLSVCDVAVKSMAIADMDFGAVDIIVDTEGTALVMEINSAPDVTPYYGKCLLKAFEYIIDHGKAVLPVEGDAPTWKNYIHPAIGG